MTRGQTVRLTADVVPWYSGYGTNPAVTLAAGTVGTVQAVNVPNVRGRNGATHNVYRFVGPDGTEWQTDTAHVATV